MSYLLENPKTNIDKQLANTKKASKEVEKEISSIQDLPDEVKKLGWKLANNGTEIQIPYNMQKNIYWCSWVNPETAEDKRLKKKWIIAWKYITESENYVKGIKWVTKYFIDITEPKIDAEIKDRNKILGDVTKNEGFNRGTGEVREFWDSQVNLLNKHHIEQILLDNFKNQDQLEDLEDAEPEKRYEYETFEDYPELVQKEVITIIENNEFLEYLLYSVARKHKGDKNTALLLFLSIATAYIGEPVHQYLNAQKGKGKTDILNRVKEVQPDQYVVDLVSFSSKALFYGKDQILNPFINLLFLDDVKLTMDIIELLKLLLDNERKNKIHETVLDGKFVQMKLEGYFLGLINRAKDDLDPELADRCYLNSLDKDKDVTGIKNTIKGKKITNIDPYHENFNFKLKCCYQWFIDKQIQVYSPLLLFVDVEDHDNRNISHYLSLSKGMTFYNYNKRKTIDNITIGSYEDIKETLDIVASDFQVQKDKLMDLEKKILDELKENPENGTNKKLSTVLGVTKERIGQVIKGRDNQIGLESKGYIDVKTENTGQFYQNVYSLTEKGLTYGSNHDLIPQTPQNYISLLLKNPLLVKKAIIINYLTYKQIVVNKYVVDILNTFLSNNSYDLESYENLCLMIKSFNQVIKTDKKIIYLNSDVYIPNNIQKYHDDFVNTINNEVYSILSSIRGSEFVGTKSKEKGLNQKQKKNDRKHDVSSWCLPCEKLNKDQTREIEKEIFENIHDKGIRKKQQLIESIAPIHQDKNKNWHTINKIINNLSNKGYLELDEFEITITELFADYYNTELITIPEVVE